MFRFTLVSGLLCLATPAFAERDPVCDLGAPSAWRSVADSYVGIWSIQHQAGMIMVGSLSMPVPPEPAGETITMSMMAGKLVADHPAAQAPLFIDWADPPSWSLTVDAGEPVPPGSIPVPSIEVATGCPIGGLAHLIGRSTAVVDGIEMQFTDRMMVVGHDTMFGVMLVQMTYDGQPASIWRTVYLNRELPANSGITFVQHRPVIGHQLPARRLVIEGPTRVGIADRIGCAATVTDDEIG